ncbi:MAG: sigma-70 family RNA polymerase sigma factor [Saprospiraceae bacterium]|nr:sigma-70 family RNA polymerase sigma factor [Saprospiraceae bacterium]
MEMTIEEVKAFRDELIAGNTSRLKTIYLAFKDDCVNFLNVKFPSANQNSEDIFNDALIVLHNNIVAGKVTHFTSVKSYLISVCVNLCKRNNHLKNNFEKKIEEIRLHFSLFSDSSIEEEEEKDFMRATSKEALTSLSEKCQTIITYYYLYQMKMKEIAEKLELSSADVAKTLKSRCFKSLIKKVNELLKSRS